MTLFLVDKKKKFIKNNVILKIKNEKRVINHYCFDVIYNKTTLSQIEGIIVS